MDSLYISRWAITNFRCFRGLVLEPKTVVTLTGCNASGKSSILESFRALFEGGWNEAWIMQGEDEASIACDLSDGTKITLQLKRPNEKRKKYQRILDVTAATGEAIKSPQAFVDSLASGIAYDPAHFLVCDEKQRVAYLTSLLQVGLEASEIDEAIRDKWWLEHYDPRTPAFDTIKKLRDIAYSRRTTVNSEHKRIFGAVQTLRKAVPSLNADSSELEANATVAAQALRDRESGFKSALAAMNAEVVAEGSAAQAKREADRRQAEDEYRKRLAEIESEYSTAIAAIETAKAEARQQITDEWMPQITEAQGADRSARDKLAEYHHAVGAREALAREEHRLNELAGDEIYLSATIERLDDLRRRKMDSSPIPGLEIRDGKIYYDGRDFDEATNTAKRVEIAVQLASLNPGRWPGLIVDDCEHFDREMWDAFVDAAQGSGYQIIAARVTDGPLAVVTQ